MEGGRIEVGMKNEKKNKTIEQNTHLTNNLEQQEENM